MIWWILRYLLVALSSSIITLLLFNQDIGVVLFWFLAIPVLPLLLVFSPGIWRNICPIAVFNQVPRMMGVSFGLQLPDGIRKHTYLISLVVLFALILLRQPLLNHSAPALAVMLLATFTAAFVGGLIFEGKSGWCGTFCPMAVLERTYGMAPIVVVKNNYCSPCLNCQKNCYDQNTTSTIFKDLDDPDERFKGHRKLFIGILPGLILWYFTGASAVSADPIATVLTFCHVALISYGFYHLLCYLLPRHTFHVSLIFATSAIGIFYWFGAPAVYDRLTSSLGLPLPGYIVPALQGVAMLAAFASLVRGLMTARGLKDETTGKDVSTGAEFSITKELPLLDSIIAADVPIRYQCRMGACGSDPVVIVEGEDNIEPPSAEELETLRLMGLDGKARLACMCRVKGPVTIDTQLARA